MKLRKQHIKFDDFKGRALAQEDSRRSVTIEPHFDPRPVDVEFVLFKALSVPSHQRSMLVLICNKCHISLTIDNIRNK